MCCQLCLPDQTCFSLPHRAQTLKDNYQLYNGINAVPVSQSGAFLATICIEQIDVCIIYSFMYLFV